MERFKPFSELFNPDPRQSFFSLFDPELGDLRQRMLEDHWAAINTITLSDCVPESIKDNFETARNLLLYSWFVYPFGMVAESHAYASLELALKERHGIAGDSPGPGLKRLLEAAVSQGWIRDQAFRIYREREALKAQQAAFMESHGFPVSQAQREVSSSYVKILVETLPYFRNFLAHGTSSLWPGGYSTLEVIAEIINQLFTTR